MLAGALKPGCAEHQSVADMACGPWSNKAWACKHLCLMPCSFPRHDHAGPYCRHHHQPGPVLWRAMAGQGHRQGRHSRGGAPARCTDQVGCKQAWGSADHQGHGSADHGAYTNHQGGSSISCGDEHSSSSVACGAPQHRSCCADTLGSEHHAGLNLPLQPCCCPRQPPTWPAHGQRHAQAFLESTLSMPSCGPPV